MNRGEALRIRVFLVLGAALVCGGAAPRVNLTSDITHNPHAKWKTRGTFHSGAIHEITQTPDVYFGLKPQIQPIRITSVAGNQAHTFDSNTELASPAKLRFNHFSLTDGLSYADVRAIAQDGQGFMWFGTWLGGLNRYDGYTFKVYKHNDQDDRSLGCDSIWALYVDRAGDLWVGTEAGLDRYDRDTDSLVHYRHQAGDPTGLPAYEVRTFYEDESGVLWVGSAAGLSRFDRTTGRFYTYRDSTILGSIDVRSICPDKTTGLLWIGIWLGGG
jgi:ligand-binding sensor domain-containing protein